MGENGLQVPFCQYGLIKEEGDKTLKQLEGEVPGLWIPLTDL